MHINNDIMNFTSPTLTPQVINPGSRLQSICWTTTIKKNRVHIVDQWGHTIWDVMAGMDDGYYSINMPISGIVIKSFTIPVLDGGKLHMYFANPTIREIRIIHLEGDGDHDARLESALSEVYAQGGRLINMFYCAPTGVWAAHFMGVVEFDAPAPNLVRLR